MHFAIQRVLSEDTGQTVWMRTHISDGIFILDPARWSMTFGKHQSYMSVGLQVHAAGHDASLSTCRTMGQCIITGEQRHCSDYTTRLVHKSTFCCGEAHLVYLFLPRLIKPVSKYVLTFTTSLANSADDKLMTFVLFCFRKKGFNISCKFA